jgi:hypothetical protein
VVVKSLCVQNKHPPSQIAWGEHSLARPIPPAFDSHRSPGTQRSKQGKKQTSTPEPVVSKSLRVQKQHPRPQIALGSTPSLDRCRPCLTTTRHRGRNGQNRLSSSPLSPRFILIINDSPKYKMVNNEVNDRSDDRVGSSPSVVSQSSPTKDHTHWVRSDPDMRVKGVVSGVHMSQLSLLGSVVLVTLGSMDTKRLGDR